MGQFIEEIEKGISDKQTANDKLLTLIMLHFRQLADNHHLATVTQLELRQSDPQLRLKINKVLKPYLLVIDSIIKEGIEGSSFRDNLNTQLVRQMIFGTLDETVTNWVMKERKYDLVAQAEDVHALLINGLSVS